MNTTKAKIFTRADYLEKKCTHREYYGQFVSVNTKTLVCGYIGMDRLRASKNEHFNDIPLAEWDNLARGGLPRTMSFKDVGDLATLAGEVCLAKEAARQLLEEPIL